MKPLYHYTSEFSLSGILNRGIRQGGFDLNDSSTVRGVCLTENNDPWDQDWSHNILVPEDSPLSLKNEIRLTINRHHGLNIMSRSRFSTRFDEEPSAREKHCNMTDWFVCLEPIGVRSIVEVWSKKKSRYLTDIELEEIGERYRQAYIEGTLVV